MSLAVLYEHPEWFKPLFAALERRGVPCQRIDASALSWDPLQRPTFSLLLNRMSPSAYLRGHDHAIHATTAFLHWVERRGVATVNGLKAWQLEISKSAQLDLFAALGVPHPKARVINHSSRALGAAQGLRYPVLVKPNIGGSGALIQRFDRPEALETAASSDAIDLGVDKTALVQEWLPAEGGSITRIELLEGELLYAIRLTPPRGHGFNLCPADVCQTPAEDGAPAAGTGEGFCPGKPSMDIERVDVPPAVLATARQVARVAGLDVCGIEYLVDERDGQPYFYDVNALSNFVTDAARIVGFDPFARLVQVIEQRLARTAALVGA